MIRSRVRIVVVLAGTTCAVAAVGAACSAFDEEPSGGSDGGTSEGAADGTGDTSNGGDGSASSDADGTAPDSGVVDSDDFDTPDGLCGPAWTVETGSANSVPGIGLDGGGGCRVCRASGNYFNLYRKPFVAQVGASYYAEILVRGVTADGGPYPSAELNLVETRDGGGIHIQQDDRVTTGTFEQRQVNLTAETNALAVGLSFYSTAPGTCVVVDRLRVTKR